MSELLPRAAYDALTDILGGAAGGLVAVWIIRDYSDVGMGLGALGLLLLLTASNYFARRQLGITD